MTNEGIITLQSAHTHKSDSSQLQFVTNLESDFVWIQPAALHQNIDISYTQH